MPEYIDREAALAAIVEEEKDYDIDTRGVLSGLYIAELVVESVPAADVEPVRHGRWDGEGDGYAETEDGGTELVYDVWRCSACGYTIDDGTDDPERLPNYCPNCGAKMDKGVVGK